MLRVRRWSLFLLSILLFGNLWRFGGLGGWSSLIILVSWTRLMILMVMLCRLRIWRLLIIRRFMVWVVRVF